MRSKRARSILRSQLLGAARGLRKRGLQFPKRRLAMETFAAHPIAVERDAALERLGDQIAELSAQLDAAIARFLDLVREFDERGGWGNGFKSCAYWLNWRCGLNLGAAREKVRVAHALATLPRIRRALAAGEISYSKARAVTRVATPETEERLLNVARCGTTAHVEQIVSSWRRVDRNAEVQDAARQHRIRGLHVYQDEDGTVVVRGRLTPEARRGPDPRIGGRARARTSAGAPCRRPVDPAGRSADDSAGERRRPGAAGRDGAESRPRPWSAGRAVSGRCPAFQLKRPSVSRATRAGW